MVGEEGGGSEALENALGEKSYREWRGGGREPISANRGHLFSGLHLPLPPSAPPSSSHKQSSSSLPGLVVWAQLFHYVALAQLFHYEPLLSFYMQKGECMFIYSLSPYSHLLNHTPTIYGIFLLFSPKLIHTFFTCIFHSFFVVVFQENSEFMAIFVVRSKEKYDYPERKLDYLKLELLYSLHSYKETCSSYILNRNRTPGLGRTGVQCDK